ncbi:MAG: polymerase beta domain protein region [Bacteriovoracaceae bacterium]|nr:polymerase beta domain protein region [Bacteriovoracaceae bacterium]
MRPSELIKLKKNEIIAIAKKRGAHNLRVFGSIAKGTDQENSDIDLLVDLEPNRSLMDLGGLLIDLTEALGRPVDVLTAESIRKSIRQQILKDAIPL